MPARNGVTAALLVHSGARCDDTFPGPDNFFLASAQSQPRAAEKLGERYEIARTNIKKWTVGSPIQAPLDAMSNILSKRAVRRGRGEASSSAWPPAKPCREQPRDPDICLQHMVAVMLIDKDCVVPGRARQAAHAGPGHPPAHKGAALPSDELEALVPAREAIVEITLTMAQPDPTRDRGARHGRQSDARDESCEMPRLMKPILGKAKAAELIETSSDREGQGYPAASRRAAEGMIESSVRLAAWFRRKRSL